MATEKKTTAQKPKTIKRTTSKKNEVETVAVTETPESTQDEITNTVKRQAKRVAIKELNPHDLVEIRNGYQGKLIYKSKRTGETFVWDKFGDTQDMEVQELRNARSSSKAFFINNWFMIEDPDVVYALGLETYYKHAIKIEDFDKIFEMGPEELEATLSDLSDGQKRSVMYRAKALVADGKIDSMKIINVLEKNLGVELIER